jgi:hypothetical protein
LGAIDTLRLNPGELTASDEIAPDLHVISGQHQASTPAGHPLYDVASNQDEMLREVFDRKRLILESLEGYNKRGLIVLNQYLFADRPEDMSTLASLILREEQIIDFIFFWGADSFDQIYYRNATIRA